MVLATDEDAIKAVRVLAIEGVEKAKSGHPGMPLGAAPMAWVLWSRHLKFLADNQSWPDRDRFILSAGHGSMLLYSLLYLTGSGLEIDDLAQFRQWGSKTPGHPEYGHTRGVETTTGPLGQGFATGVGMAIAERHLAATYNKLGLPLVDHYTYAIVSDGDLMEGISHEAASLAGHLKLGRLIYLYDSNNISIEGNTSIAFTDNARERFNAYGWHVNEVQDGNDLAAIDKAIVEAKAEKNKPSLIIVHTHIGYGSPNKHDTAEAHGAPLGGEELALTKKALGWPDGAEPFWVPQETLAYTRSIGRKSASAFEQWQKVWDEYQKKEPELAKQWERVQARKLPDGWDEKLPKYDTAQPAMATRVASGQVLNALAPVLPELIGGSADLAPSTNTHLKGYGDFEPESVEGRNFHFGVREHGMAAALNGMALHGGVRPYGATFLIFSDYARPSIRLAALMKIPVRYVFTHDSVGLGEDGPTHQPIEQLASLRLIPGLKVMRPADGNETSAVWAFAQEYNDCPIAIALSRQNLPILSGTSEMAREGVRRGAYVLQDASNGQPDLILIATGSEVSLAVVAREKLEQEGVRTRVVSMPCCEQFAIQDSSYRNEVLPPAVKARLAIELGVTHGWERWVGGEGAVLGIDHFGASSPYQEILKRFGFTPDNVVELSLQLIKNSVVTVKNH